MEHAIRSHIRKKLDEDPVYYQGLAERLQEILKRCGDDWRQQVLALSELVEEVTWGRDADEATGLDPEIHEPFYNRLKLEREKEAPVEGPDVAWLRDLAIDLVERVVRPGLRVVGFWKSALVQRIEKHHTPAFWRRVERVLPDYGARKKWLAERGGGEVGW